MLMLNILIQASLIVISKPPKNVDRGLIGNRTGNSFERKFSLLMHVDACKAQELVKKNEYGWILYCCILGHTRVLIFHRVCCFGA